MIGTTVGRYRILSKLGEGGMGEVWLAEHTGLGRREAVKILQPQLARDPEFVMRFRREARATNRMQHPNLVSVYDFGQLPDGRFYLAMEYAEGERLDALIRRVGPLPVGRVLPILAQLADAVHHAHGRGVVHRDLKPANLILVEHRGRPDQLKVLDFGIAKIIAPEYQETMPVTRKGDVFGTPAYVSPEQWDGAPAHPATDIYAMGCIAYEMLVGEPPFRGRRMELVHAHKTQRPEAPGVRRPLARVPAELDALVLRMLEKDPARRPATAADVLAALESIPGWRAQGRTPKRRSATLPPELDATAIDLDRISAELAGAPTEHLTGDDAVERWRRRAVELGLTMLQLSSEPRLAAALDAVRAAEKPADAALARAAALDADLEAAEQKRRELVAQLRFAVAELTFERDADPGSGELDEQIETLEARLEEVARELDRELEGVSEKQVAGTVERAEALDGLDAAVDALHVLMTELAPRFPGTIRTAVDDLASLRAIAGR